jgi:iron(III) transport system substrate-binding protein
MRRFIGLYLVLACAAWSQAVMALDDELLLHPPRGQLPPGYAPAYEATIRAAEDEGRLVIYSTTDTSVASFLIEDFRAMYPRIDVQYEDLNSTVLHHRFIAETQLGAYSADEAESRSESADVLWSSAMDQQASLVSNGYALTYESPERAAIPDWAKWKDQAFATTYEPIIIVYNKGLLPAAEVPQSRADLVRLLTADPNRFSGKVETYDIERSGVGFFLATQDVAVSPAFWDLARALQRAGVHGELTTDAMVRRVASGQSVLAYNVLGSYALAQAQRNVSLGTVLLKDYTLVSSRVMFISKKAPHPNAARLWIDYLLSKRGQTVIANNARLFAVRADVQGETTATSLTTMLGTSIRPIALGPALIGYMNNENYRDFIQEWRRAEARP